jgi:SNF2 family DNA or RNA helicase
LYRAFWTEKLTFLGLQCPVSLVGQWIDEAKSKLQDPGLIYPYHGQKRVRDAEILARNSIVVTTYQVIASDAAHHARKAGMGYCPPLEQVRWWRVICDEGHSLRDSQTQRSKAVLSIPGDHKWLVSGTSDDNIPFLLVLLFFVLTVLFQVLL